MTKTEAMTAYEAAKAAFDKAREHRYTPGLDEGYGLAAGPNKRAAIADYHACLEALKAAEHAVDQAEG